MKTVKTQNQRSRMELGCSSQLTRLAASSTRGAVPKTEREKMKVILIAIATIALIGCAGDKQAQRYYESQRNLIAQLPPQQRIPAMLQLNNQMETWRRQEDSNDGSRWAAVGQGMQNSNQSRAYNNNPIRVQVQHSNLVEPVIPGQ